MPTTYRDIFSLPSRERIVRTELFESMVMLVSYRNRLAHDYRQITAADLLRILSMTPEIRRFTKRVRDLVRTGNSSGYS
jgi:uncharacterized protein YutE (UPF0331/DUF86 family)